MFRRLMSRSCRGGDQDDHPVSRSEYNHLYYRFRDGSNSGSLSAGYSGGSFDNGVPSSHYGRRISVGHSSDRGDRFEYYYDRGLHGPSGGYMGSARDRDNYDDGVPTSNRPSSFDDRYSESRYGRGYTWEFSPPPRRVTPYSGSSGSRDSRRSLDGDCRSSSGNGYDFRPTSAGYDSSRYCTPSIKTVSLTLYKQSIRSYGGD